MNRRKLEELAALAGVLNAIGELGNRRRELALRESMLQRSLDRDAADMQLRREAQQLSRLALEQSGAQFDQELALRKAEQEAGQRQFDLARVLEAANMFGTSPEGLGGAPVRAYFDALATLGLEPARRLSEQLTESARSKARATARSLLSTARNPRAARRMPIPPDVSEFPEIWEEELERVVGSTNPTSQSTSIFGSRGRSDWALDPWAAIAMY